MRYHNITHDDMLNGNGLRTVLWVSGCSHHCPGCHNPETWDCSSGIVFDDEAEQELLLSLEHSYIAGVTFSGGDPLHVSNRTEICRLAEIIKKKFPHKDIWCYTGYVWDDVKNLPLMKYIDVLVDGKFDASLAENNVSLHWRGSSNQRLIDVMTSLNSGVVALYEG